MDTYIVALTGLITGIGGVIVSVITISISAKKNEVEASERASGNAVSMLREEVARLHDEVKSLRAENTVLYKQISDLQMQVAAITIERDALKARVTELERELHLESQKPAA